MKMKRRLISFIILACLLAMATPAGAGLPAEEIDLNPEGYAFELNLDSQGLLWISDSGAGEIRKLDPDTGAYTIFPVGGGPTDARGDGLGHAWWADFGTNQLGRLTLGENPVDPVEKDIWEIPDSLGLYTTAIDSEGDIWVTEYKDPKLYELDPDQAQDNLCVYTLPDGGEGSYMTISGQDLWLGDTSNRRLLRLDTADDATHTFTWWQLPANSYPYGIAVDGAGMVWWADTELGIVGRLDPEPTAPFYTDFDPPDGHIPQMLALKEDKVWVSLQNTSGVGVLEPAADGGTDYTVTSGSQAVEPICSTLAVTLQDTLIPTVGTASFSDLSYPTEAEQGGWSIFSSPEGAAPFGIASASQVWMVDQGRQKLARLEFGGKLYLPVVVKP